MKRASLICFSIVIVGLLFGATLLAQGSGQMLFGDLIVDESKAEGLKPLSFDVILYSDTGILVARQSTPGNGRYLFNNLNNGVYQLVVELEGTEITRIRVDLRSPLLRELRQDIELEWRSSGSRTKHSFMFSPPTTPRRACKQLLFQNASRAPHCKRHD